jgi:hypothetical protein
MPHALRFRTVARAAGLLLVTVLACACAIVPDVVAQRFATPVPTDVAAQRPEATLTIAQPPAGATLSSGKILVVVNYNGPALVSPSMASQLNQYHLNYLLDVSASPYLETRVPIPLDNASIIHTSNTQVSFDNVAPGGHSLAVVLTGSNHVSPDPPVAQQISFVVK